MPGQTLGPKDLFVLRFIQKNSPLPKRLHMHVLTTAVLIKAGPRLTGKTGIEGISMATQTAHTEHKRT